MATLNTHGNAHGSKTEHYAGGVTRDFNTYPDGYAHLGKVRSAMRILDDLAAREPETGRCNKYFKTLGLDRTFSQVWQANDLFICYSPLDRNGLYASAHSGDKDITIHEWCLRTQNHWMIAASLCHEAAHCAGAGGGHAAEKAVDQCYFGDQLYDPTIIGGLQNSLDDLRGRLA